MQVLLHGMQELLRIGGAGLPPPLSCLQLQSLSHRTTRHGTCFSDDAAKDVVTGLKGKSGKKTSRRPQRNKEKR